MTFFILLVLMIAGMYVLRKKEEQKRVALLAGHLGQYQIEKLMEDLSQGYLRALGTEDLQRREMIWEQLKASEIKLSEQFKLFAAGFAAVDEAATRISKLPLSFFLVEQFLPTLTFDFRKALTLHATAIQHAVHGNAQSSAKNHAFTLSAELFLMQHTCHWFCKSKTIASARLVVRHRTTYQQVLAAVSAETRSAYLKLIGR